MTGKRPKIVFINRFFFPDESATAQILTDLAVHLQRGGQEIWVIAASYTLNGAHNLPAREVKDGVTIHRVHSVHWGGRSLIGKIVQFATFYPAALHALIKVVEPGDLVIAKTDPPMISLVAWLAARVRRANLVNWLQDLYPEVAVELNAPRLPVILVKLLLRFRNVALRGARLNVVIGQKMAARLVAEGVRPQSVRVVHNWSDEQAIRLVAPSNSTLRKQWGFTANDFVVGYSGNLGRAHEFATILEAASVLKDSEHIKFLFVGAGHGFQKLETEARARGLRNFLFKPPQPRELLQNSLGAADVHWLSLLPQLEGLIVPSKFYGILAAGRPVIAVTAADGEIATLLREEACGDTIKPGDGRALAKAIMELAEDEELRLNMGRRARTACERRFSKASALRSWTDIIADVMRSSQGQSENPPVGANA